MEVMDIFGKRRRKLESQAEEDEDRRRWAEKREREQEERDLEQEQRNVAGYALTKTDADDGGAVLPPDNVNAWHPICTCSVARRTVSSTPR